MNTLPTPEDVRPEDVHRVHEWAREHREQLVDDLVALVEQETPSDDPDLLAKGLAHVEAWLERRLGPADRRVLHEDERHGATTVLDYPGTSPTLIVGLGHYDTVFDAGTLAEWPVSIDGDRISGPGAFDMKGGLVQMVWAIRALDALNLPRPQIRLVINGDEEIGSPFSRPVIEDAVTDATAVFVFEGSAAGGAVKTARKGVGLFDIVAAGVEAHAGLDPLAGASAIGEIASAVTAMHGAADLDAGTSINVGVLSGGRRRNVVAGSATAGVDVRVATLEEQQRVDQLLASLRPQDPRVTLSVQGGWNRPVMTRTAEVAHLYTLARTVATELRINLQEASVGGASDGNFVAALGIPVLDGLGAVGEGAHARHEAISVDGMVDRTALAAGLLTAFAQLGASLEHS
ncbi:MAG: M20 family metallopeptidase [Nocardioidaceae bacterium]